MEEKVEELKNKIAEWQEELDTVWEGKETDTAEVERRNLRNLINNAKRQIEEIEKPRPQNDELGNNFDELKENFDKMKENKKSREVEINKLRLHIERLTEERENYASPKNSAYKDIYNEYTKQIEKVEKEIEELEKEEPQEEKDKKIKTATALRMEYEEQIKDKQKEIRNIKRQIEDIEFGTEEEMIEKELEDGTKVKTPKILEYYKDLEKLENELSELESKKDECQAYIDEIKGIEEREEPRELRPEEIAYFHGQGDRVENTRDDGRANDEYFGFEKVTPGMRKEPRRVDSSKPEPTPEPTPEPKPEPKPKPEPGPTPKPQPQPPKKDDKIGIDFDARTQTYKVINEEKDASEDMQMSIDEMQNSKEFWDFHNVLFKIDDSTEHIDKYLSFMLWKADKQWNTNKFQNYISAINGKEKLSKNTDIYYDMNGVYGKGYTFETSNFMMQLANYHKENDLAEVKKGIWTRFLEKHDKTRERIFKIREIGSRIKLLTSGKKGQKENTQNSASTSTETKDKIAKKEKIVPTYSYEAQEFAKAIRDCKDIVALNTLLEEYHNWENADDLIFVENAVKEKRDEFEAKERDDLKTSEQKQVGKESLKEENQAPSMDD